MEFESVAANLRESFRVVAAHRAAGELQEMEGVSIASAGVTFQMFNAAFLSTPVVSEGQMDLRVAQAAVHFAARGPHAAATPVGAAQTQSLPGCGTARHARRRGVASGTRASQDGFAAGVRRAGQ